jgi:hypothetical protein
MAGAIGGVAVAAAGGSNQDIQEGFLKAGGAVLMQSVSETGIGREINARISKSEAYCLAAVDPANPCTLPAQAYSEIRSSAETLAKIGETPPIGAQEASRFLITVSKYQGMNATALAHDFVSYSLGFDPVTKGWTIVPATAASSASVAVEDQIRNFAQEKKD